MKISLEFDDDNAVWELMDGLFLRMMQTNLRSDLEFIETGKAGGHHEDDIAAAEENVRCYRHLIKQFIVPSQGEDYAA